MTDIRFAFEMLQHDHDAKSSGFATEGLLLTRQEFAEECDINVPRVYGRCLRPALYSSLRSSPSHPTGVSALRVTIAIASARFARKTPRVPRVCWLGRWDLGTSDRGGQDKSRKVRPVGRSGNDNKFRHAPNIATLKRNFPFLLANCVCSIFVTLERTL